ncbi:MFS transporter [Streptomyces sp. NPDC053741]|uniref:Major facilitator superfamily MFS_1 n=4 Tax=Streptomyces TaxID=1883 RepID=A0A8D4BGM4_STRFA|nr:MULTISPECIES: MFS transporter [Streptomyces]MDF9870284.1 ACDE family multidrug resistance protein [Streptomyces pratensis]RAS31384.1 putative MFS family arabinose efflux permease [Streptomyces avidinii]TPM91149.1 MFS transporter [Mesorhizobium sp. B2-3-3]SNX77428.1 Predicted arabinose efflux permease, MFS family [Streptomyces microflavus]AGJ57117.1 integral membrane transport protein [Streptomyces sp. PAMC 26508]
MRGEDPFDEGATSILRQPKAVWATAGASVVAFMGIGLVDPILPSIAEGLEATPSQVSLLFTSYFLITAVAMLVTGFVSSRIGGRRTLLAGLALVVVFAALSGTSSSVAELVGFRAGWGLGNALFVSTALAVIVGAAAGGSAAAILLYESALGLGMACGPLVGALLGDASWRYPFFGTAALMAIGFLCITAFLKEQPKPARKTSLLDPVRALGHGGLASVATSAFFYNYAFFTILAFTPFVLDMSPYRSGAVFFAWGLLLAVFSVLVAPRLQRRFGSLRVVGGSLVLLAADLVVLGYGDHTTAVVCTVVSGAFIGMNNTVYTELALGVSDAPRPVASAGYNFVRWFAAAAAPYLAPRIEGWSDIHTPFVVAAAAALAGAVVVWVRRAALTHEAEELVPRHATEDGVTALAD